MGVGPEVPKMPLYMYQGVQDEVAPLSEVDKLYNSYCSRGATITYQKNAAAGHVGNMILGSGPALGWLEDRLNDKPTTTGCSTTTLPLGGALQPSNLSILGSLAVNDIMSLFGKKIGSLKFS
ncbi:hypothetical protein AWJ20_494 [Sugiyamaella lignohabitans]|uniref:Uncharacterized protein n=1 Tax=Sugiyamaella lignohabitans TaxID=796027 RepID=A0A167CY49_9ASCO|nr:uncharacterized protein AWJ20_494 [Sugiyamaella lignohabitans]ANB12245.1 hypothetical protein AWJ20_494 [Sugiyamaella lignohabitans]